MSDTIGSALIQIEPDFSQFEQTLARGLQQAADKAQKSVKLDFQTKAAEAAVAGLATSLGSFNNSVQGLTRSINTLNTTYSNLANRQRNFQQTQRAGSNQNKQQSQQFSQLSRQLIAVSQGFQALSSIAALTKEFEGFADLRGKVSAFFTQFSKDAEKTPGKVDDVVAALGRFFTPVARTETFTENILGVDRALEKVKTTTVTTRGGLKTIDVAVENTAGQFLEGSRKIIGGSESAAKATVAGAKVTKDALGQTAKATGSLKDAFSGFFNRFKSESGATTTGFISLADIGSAAIDKLKSAFFAVLQSVRNFGIGFRDAFRSLRTGITGFAELGGAVESVKGKFDEIGEKISSFQGRGGPLSRVLSLIATKLKSLGPAGAAGVAVAGFSLVSAAAGKAIIGLAQKASDLQESINAIDTTMGDAAPRFKELIGDTAKLGITQLELNEALTPIVPLLQDAGKSGEDLATGLNQLSRRAVDLGSIFNKTTSDVLTKLGAAIRGEIEPARALGVTFNAAAVEAEAASLGFEKVEGQLSEQAKTLARFNLVLQKTTFAAGDYEKTSDGLANATRNFQSVLAELGFTMSSSFLPAAEKIRASLNNLATQSGPIITRLFEKLTPAITQLGEVIADVAVEGLGGSLASAAEIASTTFIPMLQSAVKSVELALNSFEILNTVFGKILPGELSIATIALTRFLVKLQVQTTVNLLTAGLTRLATAIKGIAAAQAASAAIARFSTALAGAVNPITAAVTGALLLWQVMGQGESDAEKLEKRVRSLADSGFVYLRVRSDEAKEALESVFGGDITDTLLNAVEKIEAATIKAAEAQDRYNKEVSRSDATDTLALKSTGDLEEARRALAQVDADVEAAEATVTEAVRQGNIVQARAIVGALEEGDVKDRLNKALREGEKLLVADSDASAANAKIKNDLTQSTTAAAQSFEELIGEITKTLGLIPQLDGIRSSITSAGEKINELIRERTKLINNVVAKQLEEFNAVKSVRDIERQIFDSIKEREGLEQTLLDFASQREQLAERLVGIEERRTGFLQRQEEIEARIQELITPPDPADVQAAQDAVTRAQIKQAQLSRKRLDTEEEILGINNEQGQIQVDLTGLSLDEVRSRVASARAAAAAQRAQKKTGEEAKAGAEEELTLEEQRTLHEIDKRDAAREVNKRQEDLNKLLNPEITNREEIERLQEESKRLTNDIKGLEKEIVGIEKEKVGLIKEEEGVKLRIKRLDEDAPGLILQKKIAEQGFQEVLLGEQGISAQIKGINDQIIGQRTTIRDFVRQEKDLLDKIVLGEEGATRAVAARNLERAKELGLLDQLLVKAREATKARASAFLEGVIPSIFSESFLQTDRGQTAADRFQNQIANNPRVLDRLTEALIVNPGANLREVLKTILRELGINVPGFSAEGSVITGAPGPLGQLMHVGEYNKAEAILPLTKPGRFASVLQQSLPYAHPAIQNMISQMYAGNILSGVQKLSLGGAIARPSNLSLGGGGGGGAPFQSVKPTPTEQKLDRLIQLLENQSGIEYKVEAPISITGTSNPDRAARKAVRELERRIERRR